MPRRAGRAAAERGTTLHVYVGGITAVSLIAPPVMGSELPVFIG